MLVVGLASVAAAAAPATPAPMTVVRVVAGRVDIDVPGSRRPAVGSRLVVQRDDQTIAELEVTILSDHQASCRIVRMTAPIAGGDLVLAAPTGKAAVAASAAVRADAAGEHPSNQAMIVQRVRRGAVDISLVDSQPVEVGDRLVVERGSLVIGELEVVLMGEHSATCRIDREVRPITQGDRVRRLDVPPPAAAAPAPAEAAAPVAPVTPVAPPAPAAAQPPAGEPEPTIQATPVSPTVPGEPAMPQVIRVRQVLAEEIFLDAGRSAGLAAGQRVKIVRADATTAATREIAELEIAFIASHSASCKIVSATETIAVDDLVIPGPLPASAAQVTGPGATGAGGGGTSTVPSPGGKPPGWNAAEHTDYSGSLALRFQGFKDGGPAGRDFNQESALVNIYAGHIGGSKFDFRLRGTTSREQIQIASGRSESRDNDRLYEATLSYEPPEARFTYQVGRLISGPLVGFDYLDGGVGEFHATQRFSLGAFYGSRSNGDQINFASPGRAYGAFVHWLDQSVGRPFYAEYLFEAIGDYLRGDTNREYLSFYGRQGSGSRWSLYERAEFDLGHNWRDNPAANSNQLSNVLFSGSYSVSKAVRLGVSYDQSRQIFTLDDRFTPEELFDLALREGYRVTAYLGSAKTVRANFSVGQRWKQGSPDRSLAYNANVYHSNVFGWNMLVGGDFSGFDGDTSTGYRAGVRVQKYFRSGHDVELTYGRSSTDLIATGEVRQNQWLRLSGTLQLGRRFYLLGELESATGDDLEGKRLFLQLGYRL
ncbi:MAG: hypothetical protein ABI689_05540 [Thermoanaerobaculia bacterium]